MKIVTNLKMPRSLTLTVDTATLEPGRAYRLLLTKQDGLSASQVRRLQVRLTWDKAADHGDEYFPLQKNGSSWVSSLSFDDEAGYLEFRSPPKGEIQFTVSPRGRADLDASKLVPELRPIAPAIPTQLLLPIAGIGAAAQDRCRLLDLSDLTAESTPHARASAASLMWRQSRKGTPIDSHASRPSIAFIGSNELKEELGFDANVVAVDERAWVNQLRRERFDYLLVEPVLHIDQRAWRYSMTRHGDQRTLREVLQHCKVLGLPIVLWLRVDPITYEEFSWVVPLADQVYAIDSTIQRMIIAEHPATSPKVLPPCVQPRLHNPFIFRSAGSLRSALADKVLLDGWWRVGASSQDWLLQTLRAEHLLVSESEWEFTFTRLGTLPEFRWNTVGCLSSAEKARLCKLVGAELFIPDATLPDWRRHLNILRSAASGSVVLYRSEGSRSTEIDGAHCIHGGDEQLLDVLAHVVKQPMARARWRHKAVRDILERHTYRDRLSRIAMDLRLYTTPVRRPKVACLLVSMRPWLLDGCIERFERDEYAEKELIIVVHGSPATARELSAKAANSERVKVYQMSKTQSLGACLNYAAQQTDAPFWAKLDDDDLYGPRYLSDMMLYQAVADSSLLAKPPAFLYLDGPDDVLWHAKRASRSWQHHHGGEIEPTAGVAGGTLIGKRSLLDEVPFSELRRGGSDSDLILRARQQGHDLMVTDPFNFAFYRSSDVGFHTWNTDSGKLREDSEVVGNAATIDSTVYV